MRLWMVLILVCGVAASCGDTSSTTSGHSGKIQVVTTTTQLTDFAEVIGGVHVRVFGVLKANVDPHAYEPSPGDIAEMAEADVLVKSGVGLEKWFEKSIGSADPKGVVVDASTGVKIRKGNGADEEAAGDPHIWQNPRNAKIMVRNIERGLEAVDPAHKGEYRTNAARYATHLDVLDAQMASLLRQLLNKKIVTNHDAFGYYIDRYGLDYVGSVIPSFDSSAELSAQDISNVVAKIKKTGVKAVFAESSLPPKAARTIAEEAGVKVVSGDDSLYGDTLGPPGSDGDTYVKMIRHNTRMIVANLG